jgi:hypothetical protein
MTDQEREQQKAEILTRLNNSKEVTCADDTSNWRDAFDLFNKSTGLKMKASDRCSKCYQMVLDFLQNAPE